jgi:hypothetical protein
MLVEGTRQHKPEHIQEGAMNKDFWRYVAGTLFTLAFISIVIALIISPGDKAAALVTIAIVMTGALLLIAVLPKVQEFTIGPQGVDARLGQLESAVHEQKEEVKTLADKVKHIEEQITFEPTPALTPKLEEELNSALSSFRTYMQELGFEPKEGQVSVRIESEFPVPNFRGSGSYYDDSRHQIVITKDLAIDKDSALREYTHHALLSIAGDVEAMSTACTELLSGLAYYFPCSFNNRPFFAPVFAKTVGQPYLADLSNTRKFTRLRSSFRVSSELQGEIWGAAFWEMRQLLGKIPTDKLLFNTWSALQPSDVHISRIDLARRLLKTAPSYESGEHVHQIQAILEYRGLKF